MFFNFVDGLDNVFLKMNGLHFDRVYISRDTCESALALRSVAATTPHEVNFPPELNLPKPDQAMRFISENKFSGTQPFAQFVNAYEQGGETENATRMRVEWAGTSLSQAWSSVVGPLVSRIQPHCAACAPAIRNFMAGPSMVGSKVWAVIKTPFLWMQQVVVSVFTFFHGLLSDYGYNPQRIFLWVVLTIFSYLIYFHFITRIAYFQAEGSNKIYTKIQYSSLTSSSPPIRFARRTTRLQPISLSHLRDLSARRL